MDLLDNELEKRLKIPMDKFTWKYSIIKENFIKSLSSINNNHSRNNSNYNNLDNFEDDIDFNKSDIDLSIEFLSLDHDILQEKSIQDLEFLLKRIKKFSIKLQREIVRWNDAREQLLMDSEMHNKTIALLIQNHLKK